MRNIKTYMDPHQSTGVITSAKVVKGIRAALPSKLQSKLATDEVFVAIVTYVGVRNRAGSKSITH